MQEIARFTIEEESVADYLYSLMYEVDSHLFLIQYLMREKSSIQNNEMLERFRQDYMNSKYELNTALHEVTKECAPKDILDRCVRTDFLYANRELILYGK